MIFLFYKIPMKFYKKLLQSLKKIFYPRGHLKDYEKILINICKINYSDKNRKSVEMIKSQPEMVTLFAAFKPL